MSEEKSCAAKVERINGFFTFSLDGWSGLPDRVGESTESPEFDLCGKKWQLRIFPGGSLEAHLGYISYYLASKSSTVTRASYKLIIKNQNPGGADEVFASAGIRKFEAKGVQVDGWGRDKFISAHQLKDSWTGLCVNDIVIFKVEVTVYGGLGPVSTLNCISGVPIPTLAQCLNDIRNRPDDTFADMVIFIGDKFLRVHKCVLCSRSPVFQSMLRSNLNESLTSTVRINDYEVEVVEEMIKFMYTDVISSLAALDQMLFQLYSISNHYQVVGLISICENRILETLNVNNCIEAFLLADLFDINERFKRMILQFVVTHYTEVCHTEAYSQLVEEYGADENCKTMIQEINQALLLNHSFAAGCLGYRGSGHGDKEGCGHKPLSCIVM